MLQSTAPSELPLPQCLLAMRLSSNRNLICSFATLLLCCLAPPSCSIAQSDELDPATTADEFVEQLQTSSPWRYTPPELSARQMEQATKQLREMFPLESIEDRLDFNKSDLNPVPFKLSRRTRALIKLHRNRVVDFIRQEGQGFQREPTSPRYLFPRKKTELIDAIYPDPVSSEITHEPVVELEQAIKMVKTGYPIRYPQLMPDVEFVYNLDDRGMPKQQLLSIFNSSLAEEFASNTGLVAKTSHVAGFETHRVKLTDAWSGNLPASVGQHSGDETEMEEDTVWKINRIELIGLLMHDEPCAYQTENLPNMEELGTDTAKTRELNKFEAEAIEKLKSDEEVLVRATLNRILMVGAIRAQKSCLQCHASKVDDLLGAFSYEILRKPKVSQAKVDPN